MCFNETKTAEGSADPDGTRARTRPRRRVYRSRRSSEDSPVLPGENRDREEHTETRITGAGAHARVLTRFRYVKQVRVG